MHSHSYPSGVSPGTGAACSVIILTRGSTSVADSPSLPMRLMNLSSPVRYVRAVHVSPTMSANPRPAGCSMSIFLTLATWLSERLVSPMLTPILEKVESPTESLGSLSAGGKYRMSPLFSRIGSLIRENPSMRNLLSVG